VTATRAVLDAVRDRLDPVAAAATDPQVTVGPRQVLVEVSAPADGSAVEAGADPGEPARLAGVAHRPPGTREAWPATVAELASLSTAGEGPLDRAVGIAALNALSAPRIDWRAGDPMAELGAGVETIATVGLFRPAFRKFGGRAVRVVEREPPAPETIDAPADVAVSTYAPDECDGAFDGADVCFVTGSTLAYGGLDRYLAALSAAGVPSVVLIGATASFLPDPAFEAGVDVLAGARVTDPEGVRAGIRAGECGTDLHDRGLEKVYVAAPSTGDESTSRRTTDRSTDRPTHTTENP